MRIRTIKPEWLDDEALVLASAEARVLSIALILLADDYGNGRANLAILAGRVFPGKVPEVLANALSELATARFVVLYEADGQRYFSIRNWDKHQRVDKPGKPQVPGFIEVAKVPETHENIPVVPATDQDQEGTGKGPGADPRARVREVAPKSPDAIRAGALRTGYLERFAKAFPKLKPDACCHEGNGGPWLDVARLLTDEQVAPFLDAFFADKDAFVAKDRAPSKLASQRVRLLGQMGARAAPPTVYVENLGEFGDDGPHA